MAKAQTKSRTRARGTTGRPAARKSSVTTPAKKASAKKAKNTNGAMLEDFFLHALKDIYWAEKALTRALPKMSKSATSTDLKRAFDEHLVVTKKQIERLEQVFEQLGERAQGKKCDAMVGLVEESESVISETKDDTATRDAALIIAAQKVEHYEIASYGGLIQLARTMKKPGIARILEATLKEEKKADELLTRVAEGSINVEAAGEDSEEEKPSLKESIMGIFS